MACLVEKVDRSELKSKDNRTLQVQVLLKSEAGAAATHFSNIPVHRDGTRAQQLSSIKQLIDVLVNWSFDLMACNQSGAKMFEQKKFETNMVNERQHS